MSKNTLPVLNIKNFKAHGYAQPDFYVKTFQQHKKEHPFVMQPHSHDFYLLMLITKGTGTHTIELKEHSVKPGSVFFMSPSEVHAWNLSEDTDGYILFFNTHFYMMDYREGNIFEIPFYNPQNKINSAFLQPKQLTGIKHLMENMRHESSLDLPIYQKRILRSYLDIVLMKLAAILKPAQRKKESGLPSRLIPNLQALINEHFISHNPVSFYANKLNITVQRLNKITHNQLDKTVAELIHHRMLAEAKRLLAYSTYTVSEIAYQLNFNDNSYFTRFFKKATSMTPEQYRKQLINTTNP